MPTVQPVIVTSAKKIRKLLRIRPLINNCESKEAGWTGPVIHQEVASSINYSDLIAQLAARKSKKVEFV
jgi:hypothetical protein